MGIIQVRHQGGPFLLPAHPKLPDKQHWTLKVAPNHPVSRRITTAGSPGVRVFLLGERTREDEVHEMGRRREPFRAV